ncbi:26S proteasome regulatory subunit 6A-like A, partial [Cucurbita argyrosperma subsp. sororia]
MATAMVEDSNFEDDQLASMTTDDIVRASRLLDNEIRILKEEVQRTNLDLESLKEKIKENQEKIKLNKQLPYLVGNIVEILEMNPEDEAEEDGANIDLDSQRKGKCVVLKTSTRQTIFLPVVGLVDPDKLKPGDLVGVNKDSYLILDTLPSEYDSRVKAMEVDEKPTEDYNDIGGLEKQIQELVEAIVLPMTHKERFQKLGIRPPKGVLLYGPPGTGKTLMARACAAQTNATFLKLAGPQLVQMFIGDGAKLVRDAFQLAKEKSPCIIFIDEIDAIGTKRFDSEVSGDREVQRTMLELLNQLDGFSSDERIKVIAATNRADILDPALMRSGRLDRKIEFPHPTEEARARIMQIHSRKMNVHPDVNFEELARSTDDFNGAQLKAVCVEAGMLALRRDATEVNHEDFNEAGDGIRLGPNKLIRVGVIGNFKEEFEWKKLKLNTSQEKRFSRFLKSSWLAFSVGQLEELGTLGSQLLSGVQQGLELLRRPAINRTSKLIENVVETNNTESLRSYFEAGCITTHDGLQSSKKLHTCRVGLDDHLKKVRSLTNELERLLDDVNIALEMENRLCASTVSDEDEDVELNDEEATIPDKKPDANEYALLMGIIKVMVKKDHIMQEKIISGLSLKSSSGELETYRLMWSLRPYIDDEILKRAWKLIP